MLIVAAAILALSLWAASGIELKTSITDMLPRDNAAAASYRAITKAFSTTSSLLVMVKGADRTALIAAAEDFAARMRADASLAPYIRSIRLRVDADFVKDWGFLLQKPSEIEKYSRILARAGLLPLTTALNDEFESMLGGGDASSELDSASEEEGAVELMTRIELFSEGLGAAVEAGPAAASEAGPALAEAFLVGDGYLIDPEGKALVFTVTPSFDLGDRRALTALVEGAQRIATAVEASRPGATFGFTGDVASEADEEKALGFDSLVPSLAAYAAVFVLFFLSFARSGSVFFALASLAAGILADLGFAALAIGELNMITSSFGSILVGLGIDFGVHVVSRYDEVLQRGGDREEAVSESIVGTLLPVAMGAFTTAAAFLVLLVSKTAAFRQFGLVAGFGIITTLLAMYTVLPALLAAFGGGKAARRRPTLDYSFTGKLAAWAARRAWPVLGCAAALIAASAFGLGRSRFEYDMRKVGPTGTAAEATEAELSARFDLSSYAVLAVAPDLESLRSIEEAVRKLGAVRRAESAADYLPAPVAQDERLAALRRMAAAPPRVEAVRWGAEEAEALAREVERLEDNLIELGDLAAASRGEDNFVVRKRSAMIREIFGAERGASGAEVLARLATTLRRPGAAAALAAADASFQPALASLVGRMTSPSRRMTEADLPADTLRDFKSADGSSYLLIVYPDRGIRDEAALIAFGNEIGQISPSLTGSLQLGVELGRVVLDEAGRCAALVAAVVAVLVLAGFRSLRPALVSLAGLAVGMAIGFGLYPLTGTYNIINVLAAPLIIGIGIDYAIHIVHNVELGLGVREAMDRVGRSIILSAATTMLGFGSLALLGRYRGVATLGRLLFIGVGACLLTALVVMPAAVSIAKRKGGSYAK